MEPIYGCTARGNVTSNSPKTDSAGVSDNSALALPATADTGLAIRHDLGGLGERAALMAATHSEAHVIVQGWVDRERATRHAARREAANQPSPASEDPVANPHALVAPIRQHALVGVPLDTLSRTPLEDKRRANGLDLLREEIYSDLATQCSLQAGLACLNRWTSAYADLPCENIQDARKLFPNLTLTEISFLPLLAEVPVTYLQCSTGFDSRAALARDEPEMAAEMSTASAPETPMQLEMRVDGISFGSDLSDLGVVSETSGTSITNPEDCEITPYRPEVQARLSELVSLVIEAPRLVELLREQTTESLSVGVGRVQQAALNRISNPNPAEAADEDLSAARLRSIADDIKSLDGDQARAFEVEEARITNQIVRARVKHDNGESISVHELVGLIGLLRDVPACLVQEQPYQGKILFAGANLLFANEKDGRIIEVCPLDYECRRVMREALFSERVASSDSNRTTHEIQRALSSRIQTALFSDLFVEGQPQADLAERCSPIEESALRMYREFNISVLGLAERELGDAPGNVGTGISGPTSPMTRLKLSVDEMAQICAVFERIGKDLAHNVGSVEKVQRNIMSSDAADTLSTCTVQFDLETKRITIAEIKEQPFSLTPAAGRHERAFLLAHAVGMSLWNEVPDRRFWSRIRLAQVTSPRELREALAGATNEAELVANGASFLRGALAPQSENFVHRIGAESFQSDFAACFAACLLDRHGFRELAKTNTAISAKLRETESFLESQGVRLENLDAPVISLAEAAKGLRAIYRKVPDPGDLPGMRRFVEELRDRKAAQYVGSDEEHDDRPLQTVGDAEAARERKESVESLSTALSDVFGEEAEAECAEIAERLFEAVENESVDEVVATIADEFSELQDRLDFEEDLEQKLKEILIDQGLLDED